MSALAAWQYYVLMFASTKCQERLPAGILVFPVTRDSVRWRIRTDWAVIASPEDAEVLARTSEMFAEFAKSMDAGHFLRMLETTLSNTLQLEGPFAVPENTGSDMLESLYAAVVSNCDMSPE